MKISGLFKIVRYLDKGFLVKMLGQYLEPNGEPLAAEATGHRNPGQHSQRNDQRRLDRAYCHADLHDARSYTYTHRDRNSIYRSHNPRRSGNRYPSRYDEHEDRQPYPRMNKITYERNSHIHHNLDKENGNAHENSVAQIVCDGDRRTEA